MLLDLCQPELHIREGSLICDVVNQDDARHSLEVLLSDGLEALLARGVPDGENDCSVSDLNGLGFEVKTRRAD